MLAGHETTRARRCRRGFTLLELALAVMLLAVFAAFTWPLLVGDTPRQQLRRSAERLAAAMAMSRAQAMLLGHPFQLTWPDASDEESGQPAILHEADPVDSPAQFVAMAASWAREPVLRSGVQVWLVRPGAFNLASLAKAQGQFELPKIPSLATVQFYPDGTADPALFVLTVEVPDEDEQAGKLQEWVVLDGISGTCRLRRPPTPEQFEALLAQQEDLPDLKLEEKSIELAMENAQANALASGDVSGLIGQLSGLAPEGENEDGGGAGGLSQSDIEQIEERIRQLQSQLQAGGVTAGTGGRGGTARQPGASDGQGNQGRRSRGGTGGQTGVSDGQGSQGGGAGTTGGTGGRGNRGGTTRQPRANSGQGNPGGGGAGTGRTGGGGRAGGTGQGRQ